MTNDVELTDDELERLEERRALIEWWTAGIGEALEDIGREIDDVDIEETGDKLAGVGAAIHEFLAELPAIFGVPDLPPPLPTLCDVPLEAIAAVVLRPEPVLSAEPGLSDDERLDELLEERRDVEDGRLHDARTVTLDALRALDAVVRSVDAGQPGTAAQCITDAPIAFGSAWRWWEVWNACLHRYAAVHGRYPGEIGALVEMVGDWLADRRFDDGIQRLLDGE